MGFRTIERDIDSGVLNKAAPILLYGEEHFLVELYTKKLEAFFSGVQSGTDTGSEADPDSPDNAAIKAVSTLDINVFYGDDAADETIIAALETFPMLSPVRIVIVKGHTGLSAQKTAVGSEDESGSIINIKRKNELADYVSQIPDTSRLIFSADKINKTRSLYKAIAKYGNIYEFAKLDEADLSTFIIKRFKAMGINITRGVLEEFIYATGYLEKDSEKDLFSIENDIYKIASSTLSKGQDVATQEDVEECLPEILRTDVFSMLDAVSSGRKAEAIKLLESSITGGENVFRLLSLITGHFEIMLGYKELNARGHKPGEITKILGERSDWRVKKLGGYAMRFNEDTLRRILVKLYDMERNIKSGDISERLAFTVLFAGI
jgi:DNA polymerase-3 subunit delta